MRQYLVLLFWAIFGLTLNANEINTLKGSDPDGQLSEWVKGKTVNIVDAKGKKIKAIEKENFVSWKFKPQKDAIKGMVFIRLTNGVGLSVIVDEWSENGLFVENLKYAIKGKKRLHISYDDIRMVMFLDQISGSKRVKLTQEIKQLKLEDDDVLFLANDQLDGLLSSVSENTLQFERNSKIKDFKTDQVLAFVLANPMDEEHHELQLKTTKGYEFPLNSFKKVDSNIVFESPLGEMSVSKRDISSITYMPKNRLFLSDLKPSKVEEGLPGYSKSKYPVYKYSVNRAVISEYPLSTEKKIWAHGIGVHSNSKLSWTLPKNTKSLAGAVALDYQSRGYEGSVHFRIYGDDKKLFDSGLVNDKKVSYFKVNLTDVKTLTLELVTDPGKKVASINHDRANWLDLILTLKE